MGGEAHMKGTLSSLGINFMIIGYILMVIAILTIRADQQTGPLSYRGTLSSAAHEEADGIYNLMNEDGKPVATLILPAEWQRLEVHPFLGKKIKILIDEDKGVIAVLTKDHPQ